MPDVRRIPRAAALAAGLAAIACSRSHPYAQPARHGTHAPDAGAAVHWDVLSPGVRMARTVAMDPVDQRPLAWWVVRVDLARALPLVRAVPGETVAGFAGDPSVGVAINGAYFEPDHRPSGTLVSEGRVFGSAAPHGGSGLLVIDALRIADVLDATVPRPLEPTLRLAVQCGPRLVEHDGSLGIRRDDGHRFARTGACVRDGGHTLDFVLSWREDLPLEGPGLLAFARMLLASPSPTGDSAGCQRALNLDGGPSTGLFVRARPTHSHDALGPVPFALVLPAAH